MRQYNPKKIHKYGFKNMVRVGKSGIIYDFFSVVEKAVLGFRGVVLKSCFALCKSHQSIKIVSCVLKISSVHQF